VKSHGGISIFETWKVSIWSLAIKTTTKKIWEVVMDDIANIVINIIANVIMDEFHP
jgi:hypothetical protein